MISVVFFALHRSLQIWENCRPYYFPTKLGGVEDFSQKIEKHGYICFSGYGSRSSNRARAGVLAMNLKHSSLGAMVIAVLSTTPAYAQNATGDETLFWTQFGVGIAGGLLTGTAAGFGIYSLCEASDVDWESGGSLCYAGIIVSALAGVILGSGTAVWGVGELSGYDGSWASTVGGAAIGTLLSVPLAPLAPIGASVGASWFYANSTVDHSGAGASISTAPIRTIIPLLSFSF